MFSCDVSCIYPCRTVVVIIIMSEDVKDRPSCCYEDTRKLR